jgi:XTP/dITP diphosphohydrolase
MPSAERGTAEPGTVTPGSALIELVAIMDRLRRECPWDRKQTHESLRPYLLEETYETLDAMDRGDPEELCEELGDLLLQVIFNARVASERADGTGFDIDDVASGIAAKLIRRHPHVFADVAVADADEVKRNWNLIKAAERSAISGQSGSALDGVPVAQPALALAAQLQRRAETAGVPGEVADSPGGAQDVSELGAELFALVSRARAAGLNPELELRRAALAFRDRVHAWEARR